MVSGAGRRRRGVPAGRARDRSAEDGSTDRTWTTAADATAPLDEREIVDAVLAGDREAFRRLVERESRSVIAACTRILGDRAEAEDVAQEAFVIAYRSLAVVASRRPVRRVAGAHRGPARDPSRGAAQAGRVARPAGRGPTAGPAYRATVGGDAADPAAHRSFGRSGTRAQGGGRRARGAVPRGRRAALLRGAVARRDRRCDGPPAGHREDAPPSRASRGCGAPRGVGPMTGPPRALRPGRARRPRTTPSTTRRARRSPGTSRRSRTGGGVPRATSSIG